MRKLIAGIILGTALLCGTKAHAQYNREYFFWVGRSCMMNNDYQCLTTSQFERNSIYSFDMSDCSCDQTATDREIFFQILDIQNDFIFSVHLYFLLFRCVDKACNIMTVSNVYQFWFFFFTAFLTELTSLIEMAVLRHIDRVRNLSRDRIQTLIVIGLTDDRV